MKTGTEKLAIDGGKPVIATTIKGTDEVLKDGETVLLVSPNNNAELKQK